MPPAILHDFVRIPVDSSVAEARAGLAGGKIGVLVDEGDLAIGPITMEALADASADEPLHAVVGRWRTAARVSSARALRMGVLGIARRFADSMPGGGAFAGVVVVDPGGHPALVLPRRLLDDALARDREGGSTSRDDLDRGLVDALRGVAKAPDRPPDRLLVDGGESVTPVWLSGPDETAALERALVVRALAGEGPPPVVVPTARPPRAEPTFGAPPPQSPPPASGARPRGKGSLLGDLIERLSWKRGEGGGSERSRPPTPDEEVPDGRTRGGLPPAPPAPPAPPEPGRTRGIDLPAGEPPGGGRTRGIDLPAGDPPGWAGAAPEEAMEGAAPGEGAPAAGDGGPDDRPAVTRFGRLDFPARVPVRSRANLEVLVALAEIPEREGQVRLDVQVPESGWPVRLQATLVGVKPQDFLVEGPTSTEIVVPEAADSDPAVFTLVPQATGERKVRVRFEQEGSYLGTAIVRTTVVAADEPASGEAEVIHGPRVSGRVTPPDLTIYIEEKAPLRYQVSVQRKGSGAAAVPIDEIEFASPPREYVERLLADLDEIAPGPGAAADFDRTVRQIGNNLYDQLFHDDGFKSYYWNEMFEHPEIETVQVVSDEPFVPWEILRPFRFHDGRWASDPLFLCQRFSMSRWLAGAGPEGHLPLRTVALVAPPSNLEYVRAEVEAISRHPGLDVTIIETESQLHDFLENGQADVLHFACHGEFEGDDPGRSTVILGNRVFQPNDLTAESRNFGRNRPLVFLNACHSGRLGVGLTGLDGWAEAFLDCDVGFFIGSTWKTTDELACRFAATFYEELGKGTAVGEAMRQARAAVTRPGDATYLSYTLYANPRARAARAAGP